MQNQHSTALHNRGVLRVSGPDADAFLQGLITNDLDKAVDGHAIYAALLSPQGKILFSFFIARREDAFWIDCPAELAAALAKRLALYKLRSAVAIEDVWETYCVTVTWGNAANGGAESFADPRLPALGYRRISPRAGLEDSGGYDPHRITLAVPEGGRDYIYGEAFPHDACMDLLNGVDFKKGCYVGQEIVSRMQHRGTARRRVVAVVADAPLTEGVDIIAGAATLGSLGSAHGGRGIAIVRLDRAREAMAAGTPITAGGMAVTLGIPEWANYSFEVPTAAGAAR